MAKSIIQDPRIRECYLCREEAEKMGYYGELPHTGLHKHHFIHGTANKKQAERYGLHAYLCVKRHHIYGPESPHGNGEVNKKLQQIAQRAFEKKYSREQWMKTFGENFLTDEEPEAPEEEVTEQDLSGFIPIEGLRD